MSRNSSRSAASGFSNSGKKANTLSTSSSRNPRKDPGRNLAASWGANSPAASSSRKRKSAFSDFGSYMEEKNRKLRDQFGAQGDGGIFNGVSIFVNGFTIPSSQELRACITRNGGQFQNYFSRQKVTHIICSNLSGSKLKNFRSFSRGLPVVKPTWIMDSLVENKLLSWVPYQLDDRLNGAGNSMKLSSFFKIEKRSSSADGQRTLETSEAEMLDNAVSASREDAEQQLKEVEEDKEDKDCQPESPCSIGTPSLSNDGDDALQETPEGNTCTSTKDDVSYHTPEDAKQKEQSHTLLGRHSTLTDPNFVENYFKSSRLHFIGTWRNRYRKRFLDKSAKPPSTCNQGGRLTPSERNTIIHIDMDCFFVSVVVRNRPELGDKPAAVCHSDNPKGTAEISSANYPARKFGVRAGMFVRDAKALCPELVILPYDFVAYEEVADQFYEILHKHSPKVQAVSCDEAFLDVTDVQGDPSQLASTIRHEIAQTTRCTASAGIAETLLLARIATRSAKPNGQFHLLPDKIEEYLKDLPVKALPGVGHGLEEKLKDRHIETCGQLRSVSKETLQMDFGSKTGDMLWRYCRGVDNKAVDSVQEAKSVGADVNWGVRFNDKNEFLHFLNSLCKEVSLRLHGCGLQGRTITLKVKKKREGAGEPTKYLGCGDCVNMSRSMTVPSATDSPEVLQRISSQLFASIHVDVKEVRGVGLQISRLLPNDMNNSSNKLESWLKLHSKGLNNLECSIIDPEQEKNDDANLLKDLSRTDRKENPTRAEQGFQNENTSANCNFNRFDRSEPSGLISILPTDVGNIRNTISELPPISELDLDTLKSLPPDIFAEINERYGGGLSRLLENVEGDLRTQDAVPMSSAGIPKHALSSSSPFSHSMRKFKLKESGNSDGDFFRSEVNLNSSKGEGKEAQDYSKRKDKQPQGCPDPRSYNPDSKQTCEAGTSRGCSDFLTDRTDLLPGSLSQVDTTVLHQLPEEVKDELFMIYSARKKPVHSNNVTAARESDKIVDSRSESVIAEINLWEGDPPRWVTEFRSTGCSILNMFAESYSESRRNVSLSTILQKLMFTPSASFESKEEEWCEALAGFSKLFIQYINIKSEIDIEELYACFCLLNRLAPQSTFWTLVHDKLIPSLQNCIHESYGGSFKLQNMI